MGIRKAENLWNSIIHEETEVSTFGSAFIQFFEDIGSAKDAYNPVSQCILHSLGLLVIIIFFLDQRQLHSEFSLQRGTTHNQKGAIQVHHHHDNNPNDPTLRK